MSKPQDARPGRKFTRAEYRAAVLQHGSIKAASEALHVHRSTIQKAVDQANKHEGLSLPRVEQNPSRWRPGAEIVAARKAEFSRVQAAGPNRSGNAIHLPDDLPFMSIVLGDEHLDNPGTDLSLWERWIGYLDRGKHITGISMGDVLDNWPRVLAHLYSQAETTAPEAWILFEHYMEQIGLDLDASVGGNHDDWSGASDVLGRAMEQYGVLHRSKSLKFAYRAPSGREIIVNARHQWPGHSIYNELHGLKRAARFGIRDNILLGGHKHISAEGMERDPQTGKITFLYQVASFKLIDDYADALGLLDRHVSPAVALVIDPRRPDTDPEMVKHFYEPEPAVDWLNFLRRQAKRAA